MMTLRLAWRNVWRQKRRSLVAMLAIVIGGAVALFTDAWSLGMIKQMIQLQVMLGQGLAQVHAPDWVQGEFAAQQTFVRDRNFERDLQNIHAVAAPSLTVEAMVSSSYNSAGLLVKGIEFATQRQLNSALVNTNIDQDTLAKGTIVLSQSTAELLGVRIGERVVVMTTGLDSSLVSVSAIVSALYSSHSSTYNASNAFVPLSDLQTSLHATDRISELTVLPAERKVTSAFERVMRSYDRENKNVKIHMFDDLNPMLVYQRDSYREMMWIFYAIIGLAVFFGIANAMSMAVIERTNEIGVMKAIGMQPIAVFRMFITESLILGVMGMSGAIGLYFFLDLVVFPNGIDLSAFSDGLSAFGLSSGMQLHVDAESLLNMLWLPLCAVAGTLPPAIHVARMNSLEALRYE